MTLGGITQEEADGGRPLEPLFYDRLRFAGDDSYPTGGTTGFSALVATGVSKEGVEVLGILKVGACGGFEVVYDGETDALKLFEYDYDAGSDGQAIEVGNATNVSGVTFDLLVFYR